MTDNIIRLPNARIIGNEPPNEDVIRTLEKMLEQARTGDIQGIMCACIYRTGTVGSARAGTQSYSMIGQAYALCTKTAQFLEED